MRRDLHVTYRAYRGASSWENDGWKVLRGENRRHLTIQSPNNWLIRTFLGYTETVFQLSDWTRKKLFKAFVENKGNNPTSSIIFTVLIDFNQQEDVQFLRDIATIFLEAEEQVYFIELQADLNERLKRNSYEDRLLAKPSKRDLDFSTAELKHAAENFRLETQEGELARLFPTVHSMTLNNTNLSPDEVCNRIIQTFQLQ